MRDDVRTFLDLLKAHPRPVMDASSIAAMRPGAAPGMAALEPPIGTLAVMRDVTMDGPGGGIGLRLFDTTADRAPGPVVVFFHGGGHVIGDLDTHASMCGEIARGLDLPVIAVDYRLAPEAPWPAAPDDCEAACRWIADNGQPLDRAVTGLVLCGDSAGGSLAVVTALALRERPPTVPVLLQFAIYPSLDPGGLYPSTHDFAEGYGLDTADRLFFETAYAADKSDWRGAPMIAEQRGMPPTLVLSAELDPLRDQSRAYAAKTIAAGVPTVYLEAAGTIHGFAGFRRAIPSGQADFAAALRVASTMIQLGSSESELTDHDYHDTSRGGVHEV